MTDERQIKTDRVKLMDSCEEYKLDGFVEQISKRKREITEKYPDAHDFLVYLDMEREMFTSDTYPRLRMSFRRLETEEETLKRIDAAAVLQARRKADYERLKREFESGE